MSDPISATVLVVDDAATNVRLLRASLETEGYRALEATDGETALQIATAKLPDIILLDVMMPGMDGYEVCRRLKADGRTSHIPVIFITSLDDKANVVEGFQAGGVDYVIKPFEREEVLARTRTHLKVSQLTQELLKTNRELTDQIEKREQAEEARERADERLSLVSKQEAKLWGIGSFVGESKSIEKVFSDVRRLHETGTATNVLITGESGTGKELIARAVHFGGPKAKTPFIAINCAAVPRALAESQFFGHIKGAFTGADATRKGYFEVAAGGTLFLDEIGEMPLDLQPKLLRVLEDGVITPMGSTTEKRVDVRVLAATNVDLEAKVAAGDFRRDLYYRLAVFPIVIPALRERAEDIPLLTDHFLTMLSDEMGIQRPELSEAALSALTSYAFPGNVRELKNIIEHALIASDGPVVEADHLLLSGVGGSTEATPPAGRAKGEVSALQVPINLSQAEAALIDFALKHSEHNIANAARMLGTSRPKIYRHLAKQG